MWIKAHKKWIQQRFLAWLTNFLRSLSFTKETIWNITLLLNKVGYVPGNYLVIFRYGRFRIVYLFGRRRRIARLHTILDLIFVKSHDFKNKKLSRTLFLQKVSSNSLKFEFYKEISWNHLLFGKLSSNRIVLSKNLDLRTKILVKSHKTH